MKARLSDIPELPSEAHDFFLEPERRRVLGSSGLPLRYRSSGQGADVLLLHGLWSCPLTFRHLLLSLREDYRLTLPDLLSPAMDQESELAYHPAALAQLISEIIESLELERPLLVAQGEAGLAGLTLALEQPESIRGLMCIGTATRLPSSLRMRGWRLSHGNGPERWAKRAVADPSKAALDMLDYADPAVLCRQDLRHLAHYWTRMPWALRRARILSDSLRPAFRKELLEKLAAAKGSAFPVPLQLVYGQADRRATAEQGQKLNRDFPGSELLLAEGCAGAVQVEQHVWLHDMLSKT